jgi:hypothetical protein
MTEWRIVPTTNGQYEVSDDGLVRRAVAAKSGGYAAKRPLKLTVDRYGYLRTTITIDGRSRLLRVHTAVLDAFRGPRPDGCDASHLNGNRTDNRRANLVWESASDNQRRKLEHGTLVHGERHKCAKLSEVDVRQMRLRLRAGERKSDLASEYQVSRTLVGWIAKGKAWPHAGWPS